MKIHALRWTISEVEHRTPILTFRTEDYLAQIKRFISVYYAPVLNKADIESLIIDESDLDGNKNLHQHIH